MTRVNYSNQIVNFAWLRHHPIFVVCLSSPTSIFIANARFVSEIQVEAWVLDNAELLEYVRTSRRVQFEIDLGDSRLKGQAFVTLGESRVAHGGQRFVEVALALDFATQEEITAPTAKWLT